MPNPYLLMGSLVARTVKHTVRNVSRRNGRFDLVPYGNFTSHLTGDDKALPPNSLVIPSHDSVDLQIGDGVNVLTNSLANTSDLVKTPTNEAVRENGLKTDGIFTLAQSRAELHKVLEETAKVSGHYKIFAAELEFNRRIEENYTNASTLIVMQRTVLLPWNKRVQCKFPKYLSDQFSEELKTRVGKEKFRRKYGDMYVSNTRDGGVLNVVITLTSSSSEERKSFGGRLSAALNLGISRGDANASISQIINSSSNSIKVDVKAYQCGGSGKDQVLYQGADVAKLIEIYNGFPTVVEKTPLQMQVQLSAYDNILPLGTSQLDITSAWLALEKLRDQWTFFKEAYDQIQDAIDNTDDYLLPPGMSLDKLDQWKREIKASLDNIEQLASKCRNNLSECVEFKGSLPHDYQRLYPSDWVIDDQESDLLGNIWNAKEHGSEWTGIWTRRNQRRTFDASWLYRDNQGTEKAVLDIKITNQSNVEVKRTPVGGGTPGFLYKGVLSPDKTRVTGEYARTEAGPPQIVKPDWEATIIRPKR